MGKVFISPLLTLRFTITVPTMSKSSEQKAKKISFKSHPLSLISNFFGRALAVEKTLTHQRLIICDNTIDNPPDLFSFPSLLRHFPLSYFFLLWRLTREKCKSRGCGRKSNFPPSRSSTLPPPHRHDRYTYRRSPLSFTVEIKLSQIPKDETQEAQHSATRAKAESSKASSSGWGKTELRLNEW